MIPRQHFPCIERLARLALMRGGMEGERTVAELAAQLRNSALAQPAKAVATGASLTLPPELRALGHDQATRLSGLLARLRHNMETDAGGPTPEAKRKRRRDAIGALHAAGTLSVEQAMAAEDLYAAHVLLAAETQCSQFQYREPTGRGTIPDWTGGQIARIERYRRWRDEMERRGWAFGPVMSLITTGAGLREAERNAGMRNGGMVGVLQDALGLYAEMAGWVRGAGAIRTGPSTP